MVSSVVGLLLAKVTLVVVSVKHRMIAKAVNFFMYMHLFINIVPAATIIMHIFLACS